MTVLSAAQSASMRLIKRRPQSLFSSNDATVQEMADLVNEVATYIIKKHDWQALTGIHTFTGDGATAAFPKPADYDRMVLASDMQDPATWFWGYSHITDVNEWIALTDPNSGDIAPGIWTLLEDQFQFFPIPPAAQQARFPYIKETYARSSTGQRKKAFTADTDTFVLDERLLTLGLVWMWNMQKGMDSGQEEVDFHTALSEEAARDKGSRVIRHRSAHGFNTQLAWPRSLG